MANYLKTFSFDYGSPKFYKECKQLWLELLDKKPGDSRLLENAALFFSRSDVELAESLLLQALELEPENTILAEELDYVQAYQTNDQKRTLQNRIRYFKRIIAEAPTPKVVASFTKLLEEYEDKFEKLSRESP
ncbi:MAG: hypothetical protein P4L53_20880 [Candidatus Obscuribacterales bacterium]|nr:hypothetical protein [Candidatus Obscuribacterales bacterium]